MLKNLNSLRKLHLSYNYILYIEEGSFRSLSSLHILELNNNEISWTIEDTNGAFVGMGKLKKLNLAHNHIKSVAKKAFVGLPRLQTLDLTYNPITSIQKDAFSELRRLQELRFNSSSLLCDCSLQWFREWLELFKFQQSVIANCNHPEWLKNKSVIEVNSKNFTCDDFPKPYITEHPQTQVALKDDNITLVCKAASSSNSVTTFLWKRNNEILKDAEVENFATAGKGSIIDYASLLHIRFINDNDKGEYQCVISNEFGSVYSQKAQITIHVFPTFTKTPEDITVKVDSVARLECAAEGSPTPEIAWQKDGGDDFPAARERRMHVMPSDDVFFIVDVKPFDMGVYTCTAKNDAGIVMANASLTVLETPSFVRAMKDKETKSGETAVLECFASGSPKPKLTWLKDGGPLIPTERHFFTVDNQLLVIVQSQVSDSGEYTCEMSNTLGTERDSSYLTIYSDSDRESGSQDDSTATGIIVIAVVCCVVGTSLVWIIIIYQTRKRAEEYAPTNSDEAAIPSELAPFATYPTTCTEEYKESVPHLFLDSNSEHSSKDSGTGDSAKHSNDELLPSDGVKHHSLILLNDRTHLTHLVRGSSLGSIMGAQSDISDDIGQSCPSTYTTTGSGQSSAGTPQQHTPLLHNNHTSKTSKKNSYCCNPSDLKNIHDKLSKAPVIPPSEVTRWPVFSPSRSFSAEHLINKRNEKPIFPRNDYADTSKNSSNEKLDTLCGSANLERDCATSGFPHTSSPASNHSWSMGSLHPSRPSSADQDDTKNISIDLLSVEQTSGNSPMLSKLSKNSVVSSTPHNNTKQFPTQRVAGLTSDSSMHVGIV
ncbi:leucine-rich repeats and immunoglobulin-like domains protein 3 [Centruroides sculpturatus]|uniref:leucine-rich repeats and immunoglobulin-like domains protein 3 n=1 Tax=Centruroides sculpturatus TaxID=218467 RepID=UPI000C6CF62F|nr:leucine-rich repeats and immunoglobulin-like domains protein 3 [Centruroides sculpturatus]